MGFSGGIQGLHFVNSMSNAGLRTGATQAKGIVGGLGKSISSMAVFAPLAIGGAIFAKLSADAYSFSNDFSMAMKEVQTISTAAQENFKGISKDIIELSKGGPDGAVELAKAFYQIVSAGHDGAKGLKLLDVASRAATAGISSTETAADGLTTVLNAWGLGAEHAADVADTMFKTVERGKTTFSELAANIAQVAPLAAANNIAFDEIFGSIQTITKQGTSTSEAITQIRSAIIGMNEALGDGWSNTMTFQEGLQAVRDMSDGSQNKLKELIGRVEGVNAVLAMTGKNAKMAAEDLVSLGENAKGASDKAFNIMVDSATNQWKMAKNNLNAVMSGWGDDLVEKSKGIAKAINAMFDAGEAGKIREKAIAVGTLVAQINDANTSESEREILLGRLKELNPDIVKGLDDEADMFKTLTDRLREYNQEQINRMIIAKQQSKIDDIVENKNEALIKKTEAEIDLQRTVSKNILGLQENTKLNPKIKDDFLNILNSQDSPYDKMKNLIAEYDKSVSSYTRTMTMSEAGEYTKGLSFGGASLTEYKEQAEKIASYNKEILGLTSDRSELEKQLYGYSPDGKKRRESDIDRLNSELKSGGGKGGGKKATSGTVTDAKNKIAELEKKLGTGDIAFEVDILLKISEEQAFIEDIAKQVREKFKEALGDDIKISPVKSKGTKGIIDIKEIKGQLQPMKLLTAEEEKRLKAQSKQLDNLHMQQEKYEDISDGLSDASKILGALSFAAGELDSDLGESLGKMADLAYNASNLFTNMASGNIVGSITSGISIIGNIFSLFKNDESDNANEALDRINKSISRTNKLLDYQSNTMSDLEGASWFTAATQQVSTLNSKLNTTIRDLNEIDVHVKGRVRLGAVNTSGWTPEEWLKAVENGRYSFDGMDESVSSLLDNWISIAEQIDTIESERQYRLLGFTGDDIASNISSGILDGLKLSENGLGDYANGFRDMMNKAIMESLMGGNTDQQVQAFMEKFKEYSALEADGSMFSAAERQELESDYRAMIDAKNRQAEELGFMNDESQAGEEAIKGVFSGASEESVSLLNGQFMAIRMNIVEIKNNAMSYNEIALDSLGVLDDIRDNTAHNVHLVKMQQDMAAMNTKIQSSL